jgi:hypothetical protein
VHRQESGPLSQARRRPVLPPTVALCVVLLLSLASCGATAHHTAPDSPTPTQTTGATQAQVPAQGTTTTTAPSTPPANGTTLASVDDPGAVTSIADSGGNGFSFVDDSVNIHGQEGQDESSVVVYEGSGERVTELPSEDLTGNCGAADITVPGVGRLIITELITSHPAEGISPATSEAVLDAWNAKTGAAAWSATITPSSTGYAPSCDEYVHEDATAVTTLEGFINTPDRRWALSTAGAHPYVVDLRSGKLRRDPRSTAILGDYVVDHTSNESSGYLTDPETGHRVAPEPSHRGGPEPTSIPFYTSELSLAPQGIVHTDSDGTSPPAVLSTDGQIVIGLLAESGTSAPSAELAAYSLPAGKELWHLPTTLSSVYLYGDGGGRVLVSENGKTLVALDDQTGEIDWQIPVAGTICGITADQMSLAVHGQLALVDASTGKQISYSPGNETNEGGTEEGESEGPGEVSCSTIAPSGISIGGSSVAQALQP